MKALLILALTLSNISFAAKTKRSYSSSSYFVCLVEREAPGKLFKKEYHFPFPTDKGEVYEVKGSMRWNNVRIVFSHDGAVKINVDEVINGERIKIEKAHQMGKDPVSESFKVQLELKKDDVAVPYTIHCAPE